MWKILILSLEEIHAYFWKFIFLVRAFPIKEHRQYMKETHFTNKTLQKNKFGDKCENIYYMKYNTDVLSLKYMLFDSQVFIIYK